MNGFQNLSALTLALLLVVLTPMLRAQTTRPTLDGATLTLDDGTSRQTFRLVAQNEPQRETLEPAFNVLPGPMMAPATVFVNADPLFARFDPIKCTFYWNFGDPTGRRNDLIGFNAGHIYDHPGDYVITLWIVDAQSSVTTIQQKVTIAPDTRKTIFVSTDGNDFANGSSDAPLKTFASALASAKDNATIQFRRGDVFDLPTTTKSMGNNLVVTDYGDPSKPKPILRYTGVESISHVFYCTPKTLGFFVENVTFDSTQTRNTDKAGAPDCVVGAGANITVRDCTFLNVNYGYNGNGFPKGAMIIGCDAPLETGVRAYMAWIQGQDTVFVDNSVINSTREHAVRATRFERLLICGNQLSNLDRKSFDQWDIKKGALTLQRGSYACVRENTINGPIAIGPLGKADGFKADAPDATASRQRFTVVENNQINGDALELHHGLEHALVRNNGITVNDGRAIEIDGHDAQYDRLCADITLQGNVATNHGTVGGFLLLTGRGDGIELAGNHYIAPNLQVGQNRAAVLFITQDGLDSFKSIHDNIWPTGKPIAFAKDGAIYVGTKWPEVTGFISPENWGKMTQIQGDRFENDRAP